jgi:mycothiol synthase
MSLSLPETVAIRAATRDDAAAVTELLRAAEAALRGSSIAAVQDVQDWWRMVDLPSASWVIVDAGSLVAAGMLVTLREDGDFWAFVRPDQQGRGFGSTLLRRGEEAARALGKRALHVGTFAEDGAAKALLTARGYRDVRHYFTMVIELSAQPPQLPEWPEGIRGDTIRYDEARAFKDALDEAFVDEWGWEPMEYDEWKRLRLEAPEADLGLWLVARDADEIAAAARCEAERWGAGWVSSIGVRPRWRRRGLGLALLQHAFAEFHRRGERTVRLGVDAQNPTGATRLYDRAGMRVESEEIVYERML